MSIYLYFFLETKWWLFLLYLFLYIFNWSVFCHMLILQINRFSLKAPQIGNPHSAKNPLDIKVILFMTFFMVSYIQIQQHKVYTKLDIKYFSVSMNAVSCLDLLGELSLHGWVDWLITIALFWLGCCLMLQPCETMFIVLVLYFRQLNPAKIHLHNIRTLFVSFLSSNEVHV